jgi:S1-C subfamily serine protease
VAGFGFENTFLGASTAKPVVDQLISTGEVHRAILGVVDQEVTKEDPVRRLHRELGTLPAIRILIVQDGSAAARGGIEPDDLILKIDNEPVGDPSTFAAVIAAKHGNSVLHVLRGEKELDLTVSMVPR